MKTRLLMILFLCLPLCVSAKDAGDNGYDDIDGFFEYCSSIKSPGLRYTYISQIMIKRLSALPVGEFDIRPISEKVDFIQSVYVVPALGGVDECARKAERMPDIARENGFECVMSFNKDGVHTNILLNSGEGGFNSLLMTSVVYNEEGKLELAIAALIGGVFTYDEILSLISNKL